MKRQFADQRISVSQILWSGFGDPESLVAENPARLQLLISSEMPDIVLSPSASATSSDFFYIYQNNFPFRLLWPRDGRLVQSAWWGWSTAGGNFEIIEVILKE